MSTSESIKTKTLFYFIILKLNQVKIKETILNITLIVVLITGVAVSLLYTAHKHRTTKQKQQAIADSTAAANNWKDSVDYQFIITDDSITVYDDNRVVGTVKLQGQLDSLITIDNQ